MPRYCAVKLCKNRGGTQSKDQQRISFYPFPLQDEARLQMWVNNMRREEWSPSRHQYLCSEHFTEACFDLRWGIRYLKHTAVPTIFPHTCNDEQITVGINRKNSKSRSRKCDTNVQLVRAPSPPRKKKPLILRRQVNVTQIALPGSEDAGESMVTVSLCPRQLISETDASPPTELESELPSEVCEVTRALPGDPEGKLTTSCFSLHGDNQIQMLQQQLGMPDSNVTVLCCESVGTDCHFSDTEATADTLQAFRIFPLELKGEVGGRDSGEGPGEGEHISVYEHSYSRQDTDKEQLWSKIANLHTKIMELDRREVSTLATIQSLEREVAHLKKDSFVFKEKQKVLEEYIASVFL
ncbi:hypothetical protein UPYG_G00248980 [Umbra pygmaea]|uniref:THAP domain-containing protein 5 n=1 Tax=Umbra pygmaea TaxID=75934 RepID=A0ABD0WQX4_UMBPY